MKKVLQILLAVMLVVSLTAIYMQGWETALVLARLWADLERAGTPLAAFDLVIASTALTHDRALATFDGDFAVVPDLKLIPLGAG